MYIYTCSKDRYPYRHRLSKLEALLTGGGGFFRTKQCLINLERVEAAQPGTAVGSLIVTLAGQPVEIPRERTREFKNLFGW